MRAVACVKGSKRSRWGELSFPLIAFRSDLPACDRSLIQATVARRASHCSFLPAREHWCELLLLRSHNIVSDMAAVAWEQRIVGCSVQFWSMVH